LDFKPTVFENAVKRSQNNNYDRGLIVLIKGMAIIGSGGKKTIENDAFKGKCTFLLSAVQPSKNRRAYWSRSLVQ
jgi:hypothetical protein